MKSQKLKYWFRPAILRMEGYTPGEQPKNPSTIKLNTNENPYPPCAEVLNRMKKLVNDRLRLYPEPMADTLRKTLSRIYHWPQEGILVGNGSDEILSIVFNAVLGKGDLVQYPDLTYSLYPVLAQIREANTQEIPLDEKYDLDFSRLSSRARLSLWGHPNPPIGNCFNQDRMEGFIKKAKGLVLIDEAYVDFANRNCLNLARRHPHCLVLRTLSKSFSLAGARLGFVFGHPEVIRQLMKVKDSYNVNRFSQNIALAAMSPQGLADMKRNRDKICLGRRNLMAALRQMGFTVPDSQANFILATRSGFPGAGDLYKSLKKKHILVRYFSHPRLHNSLRITVGTPEQNRRLITGLQKLF